MTCSLLNHLRACTVLTEQCWSNTWQEGASECFKNLLNSTQKNAVVIYHTMYWILKCTCTIKLYVNMNKVHGRSPRPLPPPGTPPGPPCQLPPPRPRPPRPRPRAAARSHKISEFLSTTLKKNTWSQKEKLFQIWLQNKEHMLSTWQVTFTVT